MKLGLAPLLLALAAVVGCQPAPKSIVDEKPPCDLGTLDDIEESYLAESVKTCAGKTRATCPEMPAIEAKYAAKRDRWIQCH